MCKVHIALQELQPVALMLHKMLFQLSHKVVALPLDKSTTKAYLCNQGGTASLFPSKLACHIFNVANKHGITLIPACIPTHLSVEANCLSWGWLVPMCELIPHTGQAAFHIWGKPEVHLLASSHTNQY